MEETITIGTQTMNNPDFRLHSRPPSTTAVTSMSGMREEDASEKEGMIGMLQQRDTEKDLNQSPDLLQDTNISITMQRTISLTTSIRKR